MRVCPGPQVRLGANLSRLAGASLHVHGGFGTIVGIRESFYGGGQILAKTETHGPDSLSMAHEDYLESIYRIMDEQDAFDSGIRSVSVAEQLDVSKASVNKALAALKERGMVEQTRYGRVTLTKRGREYGKDVWHRHRTLRLFLEKELGVDAETADEEACMMEHALSAGTMQRWCEYLEQHGITVD